MALSDFLGEKKIKVATKPKLGSVEGLRETAVQAGLEPELKAIPSQGEDPDKIFSGGVIQDSFDVLNALQYGVTGMLKGKSFAEGVKTRQSFSDKDALGDYGIPGVLGGIALDIAVDPLTYIAPYTLFRKIPKAMKLAKAAKNVAAKTRAGQLMGRTFVYRFGQDPIYKALANRNIKNIGVANQNIIKMVKPITKLDAKDQIKIANARKAGQLDKLAPELLAKAKEPFMELDRLGKEAVDLGLLKKEVYENNVGSYIARLYKTKEIPTDITKKIKTFFDIKPKRMDLSRFMKRKDIPADIREAMGEIMEAGYPTAKSLLQLNTAVENAKLFKTANKIFGSNIMKEGFEKLPDTKKLGKLQSKFVPKAIADDLNEIIRTKSAFEKTTGKAVATFKFSKVIMNPATHARNIMSNHILNNFEGLSPLRQDIYAKAAKQIATKGKVYKEAIEQGLGLNTFAANELREFMISPEVAKLGKMKNTVKKSLNSLGDLYQKEEEYAKMAQYIFQKSKGKTPEEAWKIAEVATFNYAQVTPFIRRMRESIFGYPFITFTYKVTPQVVKTLAKRPTKISNIGKIKGGLENLTDTKELTRERASEPDWVRDGFYLKLPMKDKYDRSTYLDLTYILPFGDLMSGQFFERGIKRETGLREGLPEAAIKKLAFPNMVKELAKNQDFFGNKIFKESDTTDKQLGDVMMYISKMFLPPAVADQLPGGYRYDGSRRPGALKRTTALEKGGIEAGGKQTRTLQQEMLRQVGIKISPVDIDQQENFAEWQEKNALKTILGEAGILGEFAVPFKRKQD